MSISFCQLDAHGTPCNLGQRLRADGQPVVLVDVHNAATLPADLDEVQGVIVCGGGAHNPPLMRMLGEALGLALSTADENGWNAAAMEAQAFAFLAVRAMRPRMRMCRPTRM